MACCVSRSELTCLCAIELYVRPFWFIVFFNNGWDPSGGRRVSLLQRLTRHHHEVFTYLQQASLYFDILGRSDRANESQVR